MSTTKKGKIPEFKTEEEERQFWSVSDSTDYIDWQNADSIEFYNLKPSVRSISLRLPESLLERLKLLANKKDVPYQTLMKMYLSERVSLEVNETDKPEKNKSSKEKKGG